MKEAKTVDTELQDLISETRERWLIGKEKESSRWNEKTYDNFRAIKDSPFLWEIVEVGIVRGLVHAIEIASRDKGE